MTTIVSKDFTDTSVQKLFYAHFMGGGINILSSTVMADFLHHLIGYGHICDYFDYFSGVSSGAIAAAALLIPKKDVPGEPLHSDFRYIRHQVIYGNADVFTPEKSKRFFPRQLSGHLAASLSNRLADIWGITNFLNKMAHPDRLYFSAEDVSHMLETIFLKDNGKENDPTQPKKSPALNELLRPFLCPAIRIDSENSYFFYSNRDINPLFQSSNVAGSLFDGLLATSRLVPLFRPDDQIDGGFLFSGLQAAKLFNPKNIPNADITIFDCLDDSGKDIQRHHLEIERPDRAILRGREAERRAQLDHEKKQFLFDHPHAQVRTFSRKLNNNSLIMPTGSPLALMAEKFCTQYCFRSYEEVLQSPNTPIDIVSIYSSERVTHGQIVNQAIQSCILNFNEFIKLAEGIIRGPLARHRNLSPQEQNELISDMKSRVFPAQKYRMRSDGFEGSFGEDFFLMPSAR